MGVSVTYGSYSCKKVYTYSPLRAVTNVQRKIGFKTTEFHKLFIPLLLIANYSGMNLCTWEL